MHNAKKDKETVNHFINTYLCIRRMTGPSLDLYSGERIRQVCATTLDINIFV